MKIAVCSDLHLEFGDIVLENKDNADVLILGGDIFVAKQLSQFQGEETGRYSMVIHRFFQDVCNKFKDVIYIMGNHEHYNGDFALTETKIRMNLNYLKNLHFLEKSTVTIDDVTFIGGTLWTDMNKEDPMTLHAVGDMMNDFRCVKNSNRMTHHNVPIYEYDENGDIKFDENDKMIKIGMKVKESPANFSTTDAVEDHKKMLDYIRVVIEGKNDQKFVVVGHHTPTPLSVHPRYKGEHLMNGGYTSDLSEFIMDHPQIKLWTHGHTHEDFDYIMGETRVVCNPRGYINYENRASRFKLKCVEV